MLHGRKVYLTFISGIQSPSVKNEEFGKIQFGSR